MGETPQDTLIKERVQSKLNMFEEITTPQEAQTQVAILPLSAIHEARYALQQLKEKIGTDDDAFEILEPVSRIVGWVEAFSYFLDISTQRDALKTLFSSGQPAFPMMENSQ